MSDLWDRQRELVESDRQLRERGASRKELAASESAIDGNVEELVESGELAEGDAWAYRTR